MRSYQHARLLVEKGHAVELITTNAYYQSTNKPDQPFYTIAWEQGIKLHVIRVNYRNSMGFFRRVLSFLSFFIFSIIISIRLKRPDIVYASSTPLTVGFSGVIIAALKKTDLIFEVRDLWPDIPIELSLIKNRLLIRLCKKIEKIIYLSSKKIIVLSIGMAQILETRPESKGKVRCIPNGYDDYSLDCAEILDPYEKIRTTKETKICLYAGTLGYVNDVGYLVKLANEAVKINKNIKFVLIGDGAEKAKIEGMIDGFSLQDYFVIISPKPKYELIKFIDYADVCFSTVLNNPVLFNNSANKYFDALGRGKPIILNYEGWQALEVRRNRLGLVIGENIQQSACRFDFFLSRLVDKPRNQAHITKFAKDNYARDDLVNRLEAELCN